MTSKPIERRSFLKLVTAGVGASLVSLPYFSQAINAENSLSLLKFRLGKPEWVLHGDGTFDLVAGDIRLVNCRPTIDGQSIFVKNTYMGDSPKGKRIIYQLDQGFVMLDLKVNSGSVSIGAELSGMREAPHWFCPLGEARIEGVKNFFKQGFGYGGQTGIFDFPKSTKQNWGNKLGEQAWAYDSFLTTALIAESEETIAIGSYEQHDFIQRSTYYNRPHRQGLVDRNPDKESVFFETGFVTENIPLKDDFIKLPDIFIFYGNQAFETMRHLAWNISENVGARKDTKTSYHWLSGSESNEDFTYDTLLEHLSYLDGLEPKVPLHTVQIDKGYCIPGDWLEPNDNWSKGMENGAREIFQRGYRAGIWIAPFMVHDKSKLFKRHQNWLVQDRDGNPIVEKEDADGKYYALDASNPDVKRYIERVFRSFRKMGFTFYKIDYLEWGMKDNFNIKRHDRTKTSVQILTEVLDVIREEIGAGSFWLSSMSPYAPLIGYADAMRISNNVKCSWDEEGVGNMLNESYYCQYFNNVFWQNDPDVIYIKDNDCNLTSNEKKSLALWSGILGGVISTSDIFSDWSDEQLDFWRYLLPQERPQSASMPYWAQSRRCKLALRRFKDPRSWALLIFNDTDESVQETYNIDDITGQRNAWVYLWELGNSTGLGNLDQITVSLDKHESRLLFLSDGNSNPPEDLSLGGVSLKKFQRKYERELKREADKKD
ncbi:glycoside hydrolase family 36 protein [Sunxiuqinia sp. A32]|uniref:glycoside hydrolase family 36 protein n=1 Tax=Sunxiuqinia sp. A32 TaxID=3461496 RepID=UPI0040459614